ncbi:leukotriene B4 receptor 1-like [Bombina bombina]|uniref:leukotriene B4 receptor 1-like n=1 Tax=Bombina bombina TaxID=8345 RepID=UPI00235B255B|nr:leukotriene B4 receptor 1-like [Bombina bombina]
MSSNNQSSEMENLSPESITVCIVFSLASVIGIPGNLVVIWSICGILKSCSCTTILILNLAFADLIVLATLPIWIYSFADHWVFGVTFCKALAYLIYSSMYASLFLITLMSIERYLAVFQPFALQKWDRQKVFLKVIIIIWILAAMFGIQILPFQKTHEVEGRLQCTLRDYKSSAQKIACRVIETLFGFFIPFCIICTCYVCLRRRIQKINYKAKQKSDALIASVVIAFCLCWIPQHICNLLDIFSVLFETSHPDLSSTLEEITETGGTISGAFAFLSSCVNPILYAFAARKFRSHTKFSQLVKLFENVASLEPSQNPKRETEGTQTDNSNDMGVIEL